MEPAFYQSAKQDDQDLGPLFAGEPEAAPLLTDRARLQQRMLELLLALALRNGPEGVTPSELLSEAIAPSIKGYAAILPGPAPRGKQRRDSWIGPWMAVLADRKVVMRKTIPLPGGGRLHVERKATRRDSHRNPGLVYLHPRFA